MPILDHIIGLIESRLELFKIEAKEEVSFFFARVLVGLLLGMFLFFTWLFLALGMGLLINHWMNSSYWGVLITGGVHLLLFILVYALRNTLGIEKMIHRFLDNIFDQKE